MTTHTPSRTNRLLAKPFDGKSIDYLLWRKHRLQLQHHWQHSTQHNATVELSASLNKPTDRTALALLCERVHNYGFAIYQWSEPSDNIDADLLRLHTRLSLHSTDTSTIKSSNGLSTLSDFTGTPKGRFIPYTAKAMGWHSDGYYNNQANSLHSFTLHCVNPATDGGALSLIDDRLVLIALYDTEPELVEFLSNNVAMTLPANKDNLGHDRPDQHSPVFFCRANKTLGTHFTTRATNIQWCNSQTQAAAEYMTDVIDAHKDWQYTVRLQSGQGIITRNILHRRDAFTDDPANPPRQMIRGRYLQPPQLTTEA